EGWRDRPCEAPATTTDAHARLGAVLPPGEGLFRSVTGAKSGPRPGWPQGKMRKRGPRPVSTTATPPISGDAAATEGRSSFGYATGLACRECGHSSELGAHYACLECFGPLEVSYDFPPLTRADIEAGPLNMWR